MTAKLTVGLVLGGASGEREVSLKSGAAVLANLDMTKYNVRTYDPVTDLGRLVAEARELDVAIVMLHGRYGEDGAVPGLLDLLGVPYQCAGLLGSAMAMDKVVSKDRYRQFGLPVAQDCVLTQREGAAQMVMERLGLPVVIKPAHEGSSLGITIVRAADELSNALDHAFAVDGLVLAEQFLAGREVTASVLGNRSPRALPLIEIRPRAEYGFFNFQAKYLPGGSEEICPAPLDPEPTARIQELAVQAHQALCLKGYSRSDFILTDEGPFILETNTIPGMTQTSLLPQAATAAGMSFSDLLDELIRLALHED